MRERHSHFLSFLLFDGRNYAYSNYAYDNYSNYGGNYGPVRKERTLASRFFLGGLLEELRNSISGGEGRRDPETSAPTAAPVAPVEAQPEPVPVPLPEPVPSEPFNYAYGYVDRFAS